MEQQQWYSRGRMVDVLGHQMFTLTEGVGAETIILVHGFPSSSFDYRRTITSLASAGNTVIVFDHLGFGFSDKPENMTYSLVEQAEQAIKFSL